MKVLQATAFVSLMLGSLAAHAEQPIIHLSIGGELSPGVYGQVEFGNAPPPPVLYAEPRVIVRPPRNVVVQPLYLHVPPGHSKNWSRYCRRYDACNRPVYFVKSREYEPSYRARKDKRHRVEERRDEGRRDESRRNEGRRDERRNEGRGDEWRGDERR